MVKRLMYDLLAGRHRSEALKQLRWLEQKLPTPTLRFAVPPAFHGRGHFKTLKIMQHGGEILELYELILRERPRRVLEVGTARGGTLYLWTQAATPDGQIISIDLPDGPFGGGYPACRIPFYESFKQPGQHLHLLRADSTLSQTHRQVLDLLGGEKLDFLFIDADHSYAGVRANFRLYAPLVRAGGIVAMHDILPNPREPEIQVCRLWEQLRNHPGAQSIVGSEEGGRPLGIGVLRVTEAGLTSWIEKLSD